jgi:hypothetical protein
MQLTENLLREAAGWEVMKRARFLMEQGRVLSSFWAPPTLRGVVQDGEVSFRACLVIQSQVDIENLCSCREAREWGKICAHGVAAGLHWLKEQERGVAPAPGTPAAKPTPPAVTSTAPRRETAGQPAAPLAILTPRFLLKLEGGLAQLSAVLQFAYGTRLMTAGAAAPQESAWLADPKAPTRYCTRDFAAESAAIDRTRGGVEFFRARISATATRVERDFGGTAGTERGAEYRAHPTAVHHQLRRPVV